MHKLCVTNETYYNEIDNTYIILYNRFVDMNDDFFNKGNPNNIEISEFVVIITQLNQFIKNTSLSDKHLLEIKKGIDCFYYLVLDRLKNYVTPENDEEFKSFMDVALNNKL